MVEVTGAAPEFAEMNEGVFPAPFAASPIVASEFVHANVPPAGVLIKAEAGIVVPLQTVLFNGTVVVGVGFTVIVKDTGAPVQPDNVGVTVTVDVTGAVVELVAVKAPILPEPEAASPMEGSEFVQVKVAPAGVLVKLIAATPLVLHAVIFAIALTTGTGLTVTVETAVPEHPPLLPVTVYEVVVTGLTVIALVTSPVVHE
jgi:hypothetical protein